MYNNGLFFINDLVVAESNINSISSSISNIKSISTLNVSDCNETNYSSVVNNHNSRLYKPLYLIILSEMFTLTISSTITAGTSITLGSISEYKPGISTAISVWQNSTQDRRYMASIETDGKIILKSIQI